MKFCLPLLLLVCVMVPATAHAMAPPAPKPTPPSASPPAKRNDKSWVAMHVFDSIYPMTDEQTFPETLASLEIINQLFVKRKVFRDIAEKFGIGVGMHGARTDMGHYLIWIHLSDEFVASHPELDRQVDRQMFMYPNRKTDIFTGWSGSVNIAAFLTQGVKGLTAPTVDAQGHRGGNFQAFSEVVPLGDADYEAGWYLSTEQAERIVTSFHSYRGLTEGYSFMRAGAERPNPPYDAPDARIVNGYNCGDFAWYALTTAGVVSKETAESLKVRFWFPPAYYDRALPLKGVGRKIADWFLAHPGVSELPSATKMSIAWPELLFGSRGLEFFDKSKLVREFWQRSYPLEAGRIWDQAHTIAWLKTHADFRSKGILTELYPAVKKGLPIVSPERTVPETRRNHFWDSGEYWSLQRTGNVFQERKYGDASLLGRAGDDFRQFYRTLRGQ